MGASRYAHRSFRLFRGVEVNIAADGALECPDPLLAPFEYVVAGVHDRFGLPVEEQTARLIRALANLRVTVLAHPTGRQMPSVQGCALDMEAVLRACARPGVLVEINANPRRLDLDWRWHCRAVELGCHFCINTDAHAAADMRHMR